MRRRAARVRTGPTLGVGITGRIEGLAKAKASFGRWCAVVARKEEGASRRRAGWQTGMSQALFALRRSDRTWKRTRRSRRTWWGQASCEHTWSRGGVRKRRRVERRSQSHGWHEAGLRHDRRRQTRHLRGSEKLERARTSSVHRHTAIQWRRASSQSRREQSRARGEERAQRAVCAGQRQLPCDPGGHSTGQRRQGRAVHTGKHYRMRQKYTSAPGACVSRRGRRRDRRKETTLV